MAAKALGRHAGDVERQFIYSRFLARVFTDDTWVLKGGVAILARVVDARHSKDVDLLATLNDIGDAVDSLRQACQRDAGDPYTFQVVREAPHPANAGQPGVTGARVDVEAWIGPARRGRFPVDVVLGSVMTAPPDLVTARTPFELDGVQSPTYRVYPVVDHIADKVCATETRYGPDGNTPSSRSRDLIDLVVFARTHDIDARALRVAIESERTLRGLPQGNQFHVPPEWARPYAKEAPTVAVCNGSDFAAAVALVGTLLDPVMNDTMTAGVWQAASSVWVPAVA
ncbi:nucleotidyl transferase AbiEii/AbiGii toxin family protein [Occultella kanbiaonis]|uniref:nucleotidyl transferase AbiEii/AbiGii toxin family protein n=1 Tax=Occultella kanbiaonis TaxID=2675754 RepID=UPI0013CF98F6|nr:nucleotidyl transferase AbiEii/AbiGii toxin family protein [Occultella kanbiaonis]